jgi:hypothetical protein
MRGKMKKIAVGIVAVFSLTLLQPVHAEPNKSIAIIDTAINTTLPELQGKIIYEVCLMEELQCPNKKSFQEGPGSATLPTSEINVGGFIHGTRMAQVAVKVNPNVNIVFIRIFPKGKHGTVAHAAANANSTIKQALDWVAKNQSKFNIVAVSAALGHKTLDKANYCQMRPFFDAELIKSIVTLKSLGVASIFASGNNYNKVRIDYPSCLPDAIGISSISPWSNMTENYANDSAEVDFYSLGRYELSTGNVSGTSAAASAFAAYWAKSYSGNYQTTYDYLKSIAMTHDTNKNNAVIDVFK